MGKKGKIWAAGAITAIALVILFTVIDKKNAPYPTVSEISRTWIFLKTRLHNTPPTYIEPRLEAFAQGVNRFEKSPVGISYRTHRSKEMRSLGRVEAAAKRLEAALRSGDAEAVFSNVLEIDKAVDALQQVDAEMSRKSQINYFFLFFFFSLLIMIIVLAMTILIGKLDKEKLGRQRSMAFSRETVIAQEQERSRIARELHDTVAQELVALSVQTEMIKQTPGPAERDSLCTTVAKGQRELIRHVRDMCENLIPPDFERRGLPEMLQSLCYNFEQRTGIQCPVSIPDEIQSDTLTSEIQFHCYRITQECLANIEKHSGAAEASVHINITPAGKLLLAVSDNGKGLPASYQRYADKDSSYELQARGHMGLSNLFERAAFMDGTLTVKSEEGTGTTVTLQIPLQSPETGGGK